METGRLPGWRDTEKTAGQVLDRTIAPVRETITSSIATHPIITISLSFAVGVFLGWLTKRA
jgi:hypothetical protein